MGRNRPIMYHGMCSALAKKKVTFAVQCASYRYLQIRESQLYLKTIDQRANIFLENWSRYDFISTLAMQSTPEEICCHLSNYVITCGLKCNQHSFVGIQNLIRYFFLSIRNIKQNWLYLMKAIPILSKIVVSAAQEYYILIMSMFWYCIRCGLMNKCWSKLNAVISCSAMLYYSKVTKKSVCPHDKECNKFLGYHINIIYDWFSRFSYVYALGIHNVEISQII